MGKRHRHFGQLSIALWSVSKKTARSRTRAQVTGAATLKERCEEEEDKGCQNMRGERSHGSPSIILGLVVMFIAPSNVQGSCEPISRDSGVRAHGLDSGRGTDCKNQYTPITGKMLHATRKHVPIFALQCPGLSNVL